MTQVTRKTRLPDSNDDKVVTVSTKGAKKYGVPYAGNWYGPLPGEPNFTYSDVKPHTAPSPTPSPAPAPTPPAPEPTPAPTPTPSFRTASRVTSEGFEKYASNGRMNVGFGPNGGIGTAGNDGAPAGFDTDLKNGFKRLGLFIKQPDGAKYIDDLLLQARSIGGFIAVVNGQSYANQTLNGYRQIPGSWDSDTAWSGLTSNGLAISQTHGFTPEGELFLDVTLQNARNADIDYAYAWALDPDASSNNPGEAANFNTTQRVTAPGTVTSTTSQGAVMSVSCDHPRARIRTAKWDASYKLGEERAVGYTKKADETVQPVITGKLAPLARETFRIVIGVKTP